MTWVMNSVHRLLSLIFCPVNHTASPQPAWDLWEVPPALHSKQLMQGWSVTADQSRSLLNTINANIQSSRMLFLAFIWWYLGFGVDLLRVRVVSDCRDYDNWSCFFWSLFVGGGGSPAGCRHGVPPLRSSCRLQRTWCCDVRIRFSDFYFPMCQTSSVVCFVVNIHFWRHNTAWTNLYYIHLVSVNYLFINVWGKSFSVAIFKMQKIVFVKPI